MSTHTPETDSPLIGKKAGGLFRIPQAWTLPYLIVSNELYSEWRTASPHERSALITEWIAVVNVQIEISKPLWNGVVIVRSSGNEEDISSRGKYYTSQGRVCDIAQLLTECFEKFECDSKIRGSNVALVIQAFADSKVKGHLSNERRCYEERRDWLGQTEQQGTKPQRLFPVNVRNWRRGDTAAIADTTSPLLCCLEEAISSKLNTVARWLYSTSEKRYHLEWVWNGSKVFIVQADEERADVGIDPTQLLIVPSTQEELNRLSVIQPLTERHAAQYSKIHNVGVYRSLGLPTIPLFILDDTSIIKNMANGMIPPLLEADLKLLARSPLVIRTDIAEQDHAKKQLLKRSDELRDYEAVKTWLTKAAHSLIETPETLGKTAFIFHNFIPATSSAFVYAEPGKRFVQIEGLWGLPEGLYYNSHDQYMVDTQRPELNEATKAPLAEFTIQRRCNYKNFFVAPNQAGQWTRQVVAPPYDWRSSISKDIWLRKMAIDSRRIAEHEGMPLSIMWFVGVAGASRDGEIMPWFHEPFDSTNIHSQPVHVRRKNVWDVSFEVFTSDDLAKLENILSAGARETVKRIKVSPIEDRLLRDKNALQKIGNLAKALDATIVLEGAILSHAYYQLASTGAVVEVVHPFIGFEEKQAYNKLVRDKIPARIRGLGETVITGKLEPSALLAALKTKLVEEAYEVRDASDAESILEELADIQEVIVALQTSIGCSSGEIEERRREKTERRGGFREGLILLSTSKGVASIPGKQDGSQIEGLHPTPDTELLSVNQAELLDLAEKIDRWADSRTGENWHEAITTIQVPVARSDWEAVTRPMKISSGDQTIVASVSAQRRRDKVQVELRVRASSPEADLFTVDSGKRENKNTKK